MSESPLDPYAVLKLPRGSSVDEIRKQYRRLARIYHPDRNPGDAAWCEDQLKELNAAFGLLSDPVKKAAFDSPLPRSQAAGGDGWTDRPQAKPEPRRTGPPAGNPHRPFQNYQGEPVTPGPRSGREETAEKPRAGRMGAAAPKPRADRRETRLILPLLGASLAGTVAMGALFFVKSLSGSMPQQPETPVRQPHAPPPSATERRLQTPRHETANATQRRRIASHGVHRHTAISALAKREHTAPHPRSVPSHDQAAEQKDAIALRLAEAAESRRRAAQSRRLKRISPSAMIRQMQNTARTL